MAQEDPPETPGRMKPRAIIIPLINRKIQFILSLSIFKLLRLLYHRLLIRNIFIIQVDKIQTRIYSKFYTLKIILLSFFVFLH